MSAADRIREALAKMTPGEWEAGYSRSDHGGVYPVIETEGNVENVLGEYGIRREEDLAGIVTLRNDTPQLLAERDALAAEVVRLREALAPFSRLKVPSAVGNCGFYSLLFRDIKRARAALNGDEA